MDNKRAAVNALSDFKGCFSDAEPNDVPGGHLHRQLNVLSARNGELTSRGALIELVLETLE
jgi:hypothetical protein